MATKNTAAAAARTLVLATLAKWEAFVAVQGEDCREAVDLARSEIYDELGLAAWDAKEARAQAVKVGRGRRGATKKAWQAVRAAERREAFLNEVWRMI